MAKKKKNKIKKHIFILDNEPTIDDFILIGIQTSLPLYRLAFDFNKQLNLNFMLDENIKVERQNKLVEFENYSTPENEIGQKIRLLNNEVLIPIEHPNTLFDTHEAFYLFQDLPAINYLLITPKEENLDCQRLNKYFLTSYPIKFIEVDIKKCSTAFPVFPS